MMLFESFLDAFCKLCMCGEGMEKIWLFEENRSLALQARLKISAL